MNLSVFRLKEFELRSGSRIGLDLANVIIQRCPDLRKVSGLLGWGGVTREQATNYISQRN